MTEIQEGDLKFSFPDHCEVGKYDEWSFYRNQFRSVAGGSKGVDILCLSDDAAWLIEIKDYRQQSETEADEIEADRHRRCGGGQGTRHAGGLGGRERKCQLS